MSHDRFAIAVVAAFAVGVVGFAAHDADVFSPTTSTVAFSELAGATPVAATHTTPGAHGEAALTAAAQPGRSATGGRVALTPPAPAEPVSSPGMAPGPTPTEPGFDGLPHETPHGAPIVRQAPAGEDAGLAAQVAFVAAASGGEPLERAVRIDWPDTSLGCAKPDMAYSQKIVPGSHIITVGPAGLRHWHAAGDAMPVECVPGGPARGDLKPAPERIGLGGVAVGADALAGTWTLVSPGADLLAGTTATFSADGVRGSMPCNSYTAAFSFDGRRLVVGPFATTKIGCKDGRDLADAKFTTMLRGEHDVQVSADLLTLTRGRTTLTFVR
jgi:hypothetical protein